MSDKSESRIAVNTPVLVIGAGPAGLTAAYELCRGGVPVIVYDRGGEPGGIARTVNYKGYRFDIGGHRFFTKQVMVQSLWHSLLGDDLLLRPRLSRIFYKGRFLDYPLKPLNVLHHLGVLASIGIMGSYLWRKLHPISPEASLADWVINRFGSRLYSMFFKSYTEKVWGISCDRIGAQWAAQRIKGLSLRTAILNMFSPWRLGRRGEIRTLIEEFQYPRLGPGMMWDALCASVTERGGILSFECEVTAVHHERGEVTGVKIVTGGEEKWQPAGHLISTMPLQQLVHALQPSPPIEVLAAADRLRYRDFLTVALIIDRAELFPDNWLYIHDPSLRVGRIQNYKNWSPEMVPDQSKTCLGLEYFCFEGDDLWSMADDGLIALATRELVAVGLVTPDEVRDGAVIRMPKAYPMYDDGFDEAVAIVRNYLHTFSNLQVIGRNGMHRYNNMDHSMLTAMLAVRNLSGEDNDLWSVNTESDYHESEDVN